MILIMTNKQDAHPTPVIRILAERGVPVFRLNTEALLTDYEFQWLGGNSGCSFTLKNIRNGLTLRSDEITALWDRRPEPPQELPLHSSETVDRHNREEAAGFLAFLRHSLEALPSIGSIVRDRVAASKMLQMQVAREAGFRIPDTCFANRKAPFIRFAQKHEGLALKPISADSVWNESEGTEHLFYTRRIPADALREAPEEALAQTACFLQEYIPKAYELRVTAVGDKTFACRIDSQAQDESEGKEDWRQGYEHGIRFSACQLPEPVACSCRRFLRRMQLRFGAFDLIATPSGEHVFLECNPNGQWLWIELATGMPISAAIADELTKYENT